MTRSARRRWTRELESEIDGLALSASGPVVLHVYDPPAEGRWLDNVIPGKLAALDRQNGDLLWVVPCEVGYGRGFGAGFGEEHDVVVLGPGQVGHRVARMALSSGAVLGVQPIPEFDVALVDADLCLCIGPRSVRGIVTTSMAETWKFTRKDERYHLAARDGDRLHVVASNREKRLQGLVTLDVARGRLVGEPIAQTLKVVHGIAAGEGCVVLVVDDVATALPEEQSKQLQLERMLASESATSPGAMEGLVAFRPTEGGGLEPLWHDVLGGEDEGGEVSIAIDSGKVYVARGAMLSVRDALSGRRLGEAAVPGLDEHVAWSVRDGAFIVAEETRVSVFDVPD